MQNELVLTQEERARQLLHQNRQVMQYQAQLLAQAMQYNNANQV